MHPVFSEAIARERRRDLERSLRHSFLRGAEGPAPAAPPGSASRKWRRALAAVSSVAGIG
jgi:hypothetical protein